MGSGKGRAKWTRESWGESGVGGSGERIEGTASKIPVWVIPHTVKAIILRQSTPRWMASGRGEAIAMPTGINLSHPVELKPHCWIQLEVISLNSLTTKANLWVLYETSADPPQGPVLIKSQVLCKAWIFLHPNGPNKECHMLWIANSSKQVDQSQAQAASNKGLHQSLCRSS